MAEDSNCDLADINDFEAAINIKPNKRRSSILKQVDSNLAEFIQRDDRRGSRRVSWANTYQYKELHSDGTTIIMDQELRNKSADENLKVAASDDQKEEEENCTALLNKQPVAKLCTKSLINQLKMQSSMNKRQAKEVSQNDSPKNKRPKKNTKSYANYLERHYNKNDEEDYETIYNTSVNKYGREILPREERPEVTLLFKEGEEMELTTVQEDSIKSDAAPLAEANFSSGSASMELGSTINNAISSASAPMELDSTLNGGLSSLSASMDLESTINPAISAPVVDKQPAAKLCAKSLINKFKMQSSMNKRQFKESDLPQSDSPNSESVDQNRETDISLKSAPMELDSTINPEVSVPIVQEPIINGDTLASTPMDLDSSMSTADVSSKLSPEKSLRQQNSNLELGTPCSSVRKNSLNARLELAKSAVKETIGLRIDERLDRKLKELAEKRQQKAEETLLLVTSANNSEAKMRRMKIDDEMTGVIATDLFGQKSLRISNCPAMEEDDMNLTLGISNNECSKNESESIIDETNESIDVNNTTRYHLYEDMSVESSIAATSDSSESNSNDESSHSNSLQSPVKDAHDSFDMLNSYIEQSLSPSGFISDVSFQDSISPLRMSFLARDDTLRLLTDGLEQDLENIGNNDDSYLKTQEKSIKVVEKKKYSGLYTPLQSFVSEKYGAVFEEQNEDRFVISFLCGTFYIKIFFGNLIEKKSTFFPVRELREIQMDSTVKSDEPLQMQQKSLLLKFEEQHKPILFMAHKLILASFEAEKEQILNQYKSSDTLNEILLVICQLVERAINLMRELRVQTSWNKCVFLPKQNDIYHLAVCLSGLRHPIYLVLPINPQLYPFGVIKPKFILVPEDRHLYCLHQFTAALQKIEAGSFNYIGNLIRAARTFIMAIKKIKRKEKKNQKQLKEIAVASQEQAKLVSSKAEKVV